MIAGSALMINGLQSKPISEGTNKIDGSVSGPMKMELHE